MGGKARMKTADDRAIGRCVRCGARRIERTCGFCGLQDGHDVVLWLRERDVKNLAYGDVTVHAAGVAAEALRVRGLLGGSK